MQQRISKIGIVMGLIWSLILLVNGSATVFAQSDAPEAATPPRARIHRTILPNEWSVSYPAGVAYSITHKRFFLLDKRTADPNGSQQPRLVTLSPYEERLGSTLLPFRPEDAMNFTFDDSGNRLLFLNLTAKEMIQIKLNSRGLPDLNTLTRMDITRLGIQGVAGMAVDATNKQLWILDPPALQTGAAGQLIRMSLTDALASAPFEKLALPTSINKIALRGLAIHPETHNLFLFSPAQKRLYEFTAALQAAGQIDTSNLGLVDPRAWVAVYTPDLTDNSKNVRLYVADSNLSGFIPAPRPIFGRLIEVAWNANTLQVGAASPHVVNLTLVRTTNTSAFVPPSPDPSGIDYIPDLDTMLISDGEVDEMPALFAGDNLFGTKRSGDFLFSETTLPFPGTSISSTEPTGAAYNPANKHLFTSNDDAKEIFEINPGGDNTLFTGDDSVTSFDTHVFGAEDAEGITFDTASGDLFISDGVNAEIYRVDAGVNGVFDGVPPAGDDVVTHFDTAALGLTDPEGITFDDASGNLVIVGEPIDHLFEISTGGVLVRELIMQGVATDAPAGLAMAPGSVDASFTNYFVVDRGVDNNIDPNENDGRLFEFTTSSTPPGDVLYLSTTSGGAVGGITFSDEDILTYNRTTNTWARFFDGSDVGLADNDVDGFELLDDGSLLLSLDISQTITGVTGTVQSSDILQFTPTSLGTNTSGSYSLFLDGSDVGLSSNENEDIDSLGFLPDGRLVISTRGTVSATGLLASAADEDLIVLNAASFGPTTSGTWALYFDGSDVGLTDGDEDLRGVEIDSNGDIELTTLAAFTVTGVSGDASDIFVCTPSSTGATTACTFSSFFDGDASPPGPGFGGESIDGLARTVNLAVAAHIPISYADDSAEEVERGADPSDVESPEPTDEEEAVPQLFLPMANR